MSHAFIAYAVILWHCVGSGGDGPYKYLKYKNEQGRMH